MTGNSFSNISSETGEIGAETGHVYSVGSQVTPGSLNGLTPMITISYRSPKHDTEDRIEGKSHGKWNNETIQR